MSLFIFKQKNIFLLNNVIIFNFKSYKTKNPKQRGETQNTKLTKMRLSQNKDTKLTNYSIPFGSNGGGGGGNKNYSSSRKASGSSQSKLSNDTALKSASISSSVIERVTIGAVTALRLAEEVVVAGVGG